MQNATTHTGKDVEKEVSSGMNTLKERAGHFAQNAGETLKGYGESAKGMAHDANNTTLADMEKKIGKGISDHPGGSIAGVAITAALAGLVTGMLLHRLW